MAGKRGNFGKQFKAFVRDESKDGGLSNVDLTPAEPKPAGPGAKKSLTETIGDVLEMTDEEFALFKARKNLKKRERVAISMVARCEELPLRGGPQILAELLDRRDGKVVLTHRLVGNGTASDMSDAEISAVWDRRQSRAAEQKALMRPPGSSFQQ